MKKMTLLLFFCLVISIINAQTGEISQEIFDELNIQSKINSFPRSKSYKLLFKDDNKSIFEFIYESSIEFEYPNGIIIIDNTEGNFDYIVSYSMGMNNRKIIVSKRFRNIYMCEYFDESIIQFLNGKKVFDKPY